MSNFRNGGTQPFRAVCSQDPAFDADADGWDEYYQDRNPDHLKVLDGQRPAIFHCRHLTLNERREVRNKITDADQYEAAFVRGVVKVENLRHPDGTQRDWHRPDDRSGKQKPIPDSALEEYFSEDEIREIGMQVLIRSFLAKTRNPVFPVLPISVLAVKGNLLPRVAQMNGSLNSKDSKPSQEAPQGEVQKS